MTLPEVERDDQLPEEVEAVVRDPEVVLPGEMELFEHIYDWSNVQPAPTMSREPTPKNRRWPR